LGDKFSGQFSNPVPVVDVVAAATLPVEAAMLGFLTAQEKS